MAIAAVVLIHNTPPGIWQVWCRPFVNWSVGLFLFLSGMLSSADRWSPRKRIAKVLIPYALWTFVYVLLGSLKAPVEIPYKYVRCLLFGNAAAVMYYVFVYCELTLLIPTVDRLARSKWRLVGLAVSPAEVVFLRLLPMLAGIEIGGLPGVVQRLSCVGWFSYFYLGYLLGNGLLEARLSTRTLVLVGGGSLLLQVIEGWWQLSLGNANCGSQLKLSALLTGSVVVVLAYKYILYEKTSAPKIMLLLGDFSFEYTSRISPLWSCCPKYRSTRSASSIP